MAAGGGVALGPILNNTAILSVRCFAILHADLSFATKMRQNELSSPPKYLRFSFSFIATSNYNNKFFNNIYALYLNKYFWHI